MTTTFEHVVSAAGHLLDPAFTPLGARLTKRSARPGKASFELSYLRWTITIDLFPLGGSDEDVVIEARLGSQRPHLRSERLLEAIVGPGRELSDLGAALMQIRVALRRHADVARELARHAA